MTEETAYQIKIDVFEGPFDLLLQAIDDGRIEIYQVSLAQVTASYFEYWRAESPDLLLASDFLYLAAYLIEQKSKSLLPVKAELFAEGELTDIEESLVAHLQEYQVFKKMAVSLKERKEIFSKIYVRHEGEKVEGEIELVDVNLRDLVLAFQRVYREAAEREKVVQIKLEEITLEKRLAEITKLLNERQGGIYFEELFFRKTRLEVVVTFLAILELAKQRFLRITQEGRFGNIMIFTAQAAVKLPVGEVENGNGTN